MTTISTTYALKYQCKFAPQYKWSKCKKLFNTRTGKQIKKTLNGGSIGYWIASNFYTVKKLKTEIELIEDIKTPF